MYIEFNSLNAIYTFNVIQVEILVVVFDVENID